MVGRHEGKGKRRNQRPGTVEVSVRVDDRRSSLVLVDNPDQGVIDEAIGHQLASMPEYRTGVARTVAIKMVRYDRGLRQLTKIADGWLAVNPGMRWAIYLLAGLLGGLALRPEVQTVTRTVWQFATGWL